MADQFIYKLNAMENAAQSDCPAANGYGDKREAVLDHVAALAAKLARAQAAVRWADSVIEYLDWEEQFAQAIREAKESKHG